MKGFAVKAWIGSAGFVVGLVGMALAIDWIVWIGVGCLGLAFLLRFVKPSSANSGGVDA
jgi:hypothetical protein